MNCGGKFMHIRATFGRATLPRSLPPSTDAARQEPRPTILSRFRILAHSLPRGISQGHIHACAGGGGRRSVHERHVARGELPILRFARTLGHELGHYESGGELPILRLAGRWERAIPEQPGGELFLSFFAFFGHTARAAGNPQHQPRLGSVGPILRMEIHLL